MKRRRQRRLEALRKHKRFLKLVMKMWRCIAKKSKEAQDFRRLQRDGPYQKYTNMTQRRQSVKNENAQNSFTKSSQIQTLSR